ncbi:F-box/kelch-repeat protein At3g06240-like isoform X1 [Argentina anserina]|uniref:F-box/kelch-repeat protein At3g06240-like isoform X1 n=1 Tax=Argentina anserina TaxID=57926 RepID=UPI0021768116|nr:F-box/kelch-repeat protein At3g06240-like isoform X1 [Potentilla anserina]
MPPGFNVVEEDEYYVNVFEGCLCLGKKDDLVFWVMKEYGVAKSWIRVRMPIPFYGGLHCGFVKKKYHLLLLQENMRLQLAMYNFGRKKIRNLSICGVSEPCSAGIYLESLVSPNNYCIPQSLSIAAAMQVEYEQVHFHQRTS